MHALIVGEPGVGKSALIRQVLEELDVPVPSYETRKADALADGLGSPIYIYDEEEPRSRTEDNREEILPEVLAFVRAQLRSH